jgi:2,3-dihydroxybenzoate-AMP ligase
MNVDEEIIDASHPVEPFETSTAAFYGPHGGLRARGRRRRIEGDDLATLARDALEADTDGPGYVLGAISFDGSRSSLCIPATVRRVAPGEPVLATPSSSSVGPLVLDEWPTGEHYQQVVAEAVARIDRGELEKVVLSRTLVARGEALDSADLLDRLHRRDPAAVAYSLPVGTGADPVRLVGATPELLASRHGTSVIARPLAGSLPRGADADDDARRAAALLASAKDLHEHAVVVDAILDGLSPLCADVVVDGPFVLTTATVLHLATEIRGELRDPSTTALDVALALHPTPAICGRPVGVARQAIADLEGFDRGWFSGLVGWMDRRGDGEWYLAIRSATVAGSDVTMFAGAGIVAGSVPAAELTETAAKLETVLGALTGAGTGAVAPGADASTSEPTDRDVTPWPPADAARWRALGCWAGRTLAGDLVASAQRHPDREVVSDGARRLTYAELVERSRRVASGLRELGIEAGDRVVLQLPNVVEFLEVTYALFHLGALPVFAQPAHRSAELGSFCEIAEVAAIVTAHPQRRRAFDHVGLALDVRVAHPSVRHVIAVGEPLGEVHASVVAFERLAEHAPLDLDGGPSASDVAFLQLSGGSTGVPKLIPRTHDDYLYSVRTSVEVCGFDGDTVYMVVLPVGHNFPMSSPGVLGVVHAGGRIVLAPSSTPDVAFALIADERVTHTAAVPAIAQVWLDAAERRSPDLPTLEVLQVGGAHFADDVAARVRPTLGCSLQQVFGMAEGLVNYTRLDEGDGPATTTQGRPMSPYDEVLVVDDHDVEVAPGEVGHLLTRGPYTIRGYYRADAHNRRAFTPDGFYRTGDMVRLTPDGSLVVVGRAKDQVNRGGEKIAAEEVEQHLLAHHGVLDAALVAITDAALGEKSLAVVVPRGDAPSAAELRGFLRERGLATYKIPDEVEIAAALPRTAIGKVDKVALRAAWSAGRDGAPAPTAADAAGDTTAGDTTAGDTTAPPTRGSSTMTAPATSPLPSATTIDVTERRLPSIAGYPLPSLLDLPPNRAGWRLDPSRCVLLVHDMQNYFVDAFGDAPSPMPTVLANLQALTAACRARGVPVVFSAQPPSQDPAERALLLDFWGPGLTDDGRQPRIVDALTPTGDDQVMVKWRYSAFQRTDLLERLQAAGRDQLVVTGIYAHLGCLLTAYEAFMKDIQPFFVADALADFSAEEHRQALVWAATRCAVVLDAASALDQLDGGAA